MEILEAPWPFEEVAHDQERPPLADQLERLRHRAGLVVPLGLAGAPRLGVCGAGVATIVAFGLGCVVLVWYLLSGRSVVTPTLRGVRLRGALFADVLRVGAPGALNTVQTNLTVVLLTGLVGSFGTFTLAGYGVAARLEYLQIPLVFGFGGALVTMVGTNVGAGQRPHGRHPGARARKVTASPFPADPPALHPLPARAEDPQRQRRSGSVPNGSRHAEQRRGATVPASRHSSAPVLPFSAHSAARGQRSPTCLAQVELPLGGKLHRSAQDVVFSSHLADGVEPTPRRASSEVVVGEADHGVGLGVDRPLEGARPDDERSEP
ncbi:MAG: hypothetical protein HYU51_17910 [Candidatus Rokubacteria bacterium]|nr:hypothetical protein [Candidatus Rokubacteria bacterium]